MHRDKLDKVDEITIKLGYLISEKCRNLLSNIDATSTKQLLDFVKAASCHCNTSEELLSCVGDENVMNKFFADISTHPFIINRNY